MPGVKQNALDTSVQFLKSVGPKRSAAFSKIGINTIRDLLFYFPSKHLDRSTTLSISKAVSYINTGYNGEVTIIAKVISVDLIRARKTFLKVIVTDLKGFSQLFFFNSVKIFENIFSPGKTYAISGKPTLNNHDELIFTHPDFDYLGDDETAAYLNTGKIIPFYRIPKELKSSNIGDIGLRRIISSALEAYGDGITETLPKTIVEKNNLISSKEAVKHYHYPESADLLAKAVERFKFEELFFLEILVAIRKRNLKVKFAGNPMAIKTSLVKDFLKILPFELTQSQLKVLGEIRKDMESSNPMNRLLQGDVGSGKTIVALISMLIAIDNGYQAVLMAPTEILADQHAKSISNLMNKLFESHTERQIKVSLLLGGQKKSERTKQLLSIESQEADIIIGTHALFEDNVVFRKLGLVVVDEQHRFGVEQRARLQAKGNSPHIMVMSATPIPRTLSMTVYGDLDVSIISEMPKNRIPIKTFLRGDSKLPDIFRFILDKHKEGYQSFVVYPLVEESEKLELKSAEVYYNSLKETYFKDLNVGLLHGKMNWKQKEEVMYQFKRKDFDILIATTVIEVGIDIPDANIIVINDAHRFGLSQLHQLRGRVGRSNKQAYCVLVTKDEFLKYSYKNLDLEYLSETIIEKYKSTVRMQAMVQYTDGFKLAEIDLKLRGPGNIFGTRQSGYPELKYSDITADSELLFKAKDDAFQLIDNDPSLISEEGKIIKENLERYFLAGLKYASIA